MTPLAVVPFAVVPFGVVPFDVVPFADALAGGMGAALRFLVDGALRRRFPLLPTLVVNVSGSLALGVVAGLVLRGGVDGPLGAVLGTGLLGGYTTFSAAGVETVQLVAARRYVAAALVSVGMLLLSVLACALGLAVARAI